MPLLLEGALTTNVYAVPRRHAGHPHRCVCVTRGGHVGEALAFGALARVLSGTDNARRARRPGGGDRQNMGASLIVCGAHVARSGDGEFQFLALDGNDHRVRGRRALRQLHARAGGARRPIRRVR